MYSGTVHVTSCLSKCILQILWFRDLQALTLQSKVSKVGYLAGPPQGTSVQHATDFASWTSDFEGKPLPSGRKAGVPREKPTNLNWTHTLAKDIGVQQLEQPLCHLRPDTCFPSPFMLLIYLHFEHDKDDKEEGRPLVEGFLSLLCLLVKQAWCKHMVLKYMGGD